MINDFSNAVAEKQASGFARVEIFRGTCYGSPALEIEFDFAADGEKTPAQFSEGSKKRTLSLDRAEAENFLRGIFAIIERAEVFAGLRHVDVRYHAEIEWHALDFAGNEKSGQLKVFSDEWQIDEIEDVINDEAENAEIAERYQNILDRNPHRRAIEIYLLTRRFFRKHFNY